MAFSFDFIANIIIIFAIKLFWGLKICHKDKVVHLAME
jgi:hypothetical protein